MNIRFATKDVRFCREKGVIHDSCSREGKPTVYRHNPRKRPLLARVSLRCMLVGLACLSACVDINGGAIELRWVINNAQGVRSSCQATGLGKIQLFLAPQENPDAGPSNACPESQCVFPCAPGVANTAFFIVSGAYSIWIRARDATTDQILDASDGISTPPPILRRVERGGVTDLGVNLIAVNR